ncbi:hypothetical protein ANCCAN_05952 [Ancylostoma caninum]|uniref:Histidine acid phosphatase n=1 Tax=Ancylostoma caninum TaxID=29170 RepID=A0A368GUG9_ANCCA|nr:hypothetical protein ANCCAN_05952 [Ancylostoma caninum]
MNAQLSVEKFPPVTILRQTYRRTASENAEDRFERQWLSTAHDTTLAAMLSTLGIYPAEFPRYATAVLLELHDRNGQLVIEVYHKNMTDVDSVYRYLIPGCPDPCTLDALRSTVEK